MHNHEMLGWFVLMLGLLFSAIVLSFLIRKKINEKNTLVWLGSAVLILILAVNPNMLDDLAGFVGISYPPTLLFLLSLMVLLMLNLYQSIQISTLHDRIKELSQYIALRDAHESQEERSKLPYENNRSVS